MLLFVKIFFLFYRIESTPLNIIFEVKIKSVKQRYLVVIHLSACSFIVLMSAMYSWKKNTL